MFTQRDVFCLVYSLTIVINFKLMILTKRKVYVHLNSVYFIKVNTTK